MGRITRFIADLHLYDSYSLDWRSLDVEAYARLLKDNWNDVVAKDDITIVVGDIGHECPKTIELLKSLNGLKILVIGNHDREWNFCNLQNCGVFSGIHEFIKMDDIMVEHIPDEENLHKSYYIHGHHHLYTVPNMQRKFQRYANDTFRLNCASDLIGHTPRTLSELVLCKEKLLYQVKEK